MAEPVRIPFLTHASVVLRSFAVQAAWQYERLIGNGIAFSLLPVLSRLPGGLRGERGRAAVAREATYFNAHPYLTPLALGALGRLEVDGESDEKLMRFRRALPGPLGSLGDNLVWAAWLPACSLVALLAYGVGLGAAGVAALFLLIYNCGHLLLRVWGYREGWRHGVRLSAALAAPWLREGPRYIGRGAALVAGFALPLASRRAIGGGPALDVVPISIAVLTPVLALLLVRLHGKAEGWRVAFGLLAALVLYSTILHR